MKVQIKRILIALMLLTVVTFVAILIYSKGRTYFNEENVIGNSAGNLYNGGLFCEQGGKIYFSNDNDDGSLYVMNSDSSNIKKIHNDKVAYINADDNYLYYLRANNTKENNPGTIFIFNNTGVYRLNHNGSQIKLICSNPCGLVALGGNNLYLQRYTVEDGLKLYSYRIDGSMEALIQEDAILPAAIVNNKLYYSGVTEDHNIKIMDLSDNSISTLSEGNYAQPVVNGAYIYYLSQSDNYTIGRMNLDGTNQETVVSERCFTYNITNNGQYLYYQVDDGKNNGICRMNLETMKSETILEGNYKQIHVTDNYVFFKDYENTSTFIISTDGVGKLSTFSPPNLNAK